MDALAKHKAREGAQSTPNILAAQYSSKVTILYITSATQQHNSMQTNEQTYNNNNNSNNERLKQNNKKHKRHMTAIRSRRTSVVGGVVVGRVNLSIDKKQKKDVVCMCVCFYV